MDLFHLILYLTHFMLLACNGDKLLTFGGGKKINTLYGKDNFHSIARRSIPDKSDKICKDSLDTEAENKIIKHPFPLKNDRNMDLQLVFVGENSETQLLLTTMAQNFLSFLMMSRHVSSNLYQSIDGGRTFQKLDKKINSASIRSSYGIMKSPLDRNWVIFVSYTSFFSTSFSFPFHTQVSSLLISKNACKNFTTVKMPFKLRSNEPLLFHPKKKNWIIGLEESRTASSNGKVMVYGQAFITKDFGKTWKAMKKGYIVASAKWGAAEGKEGDEIYLATHTKIGTGIKSFFSIFDTFSSSSTLTLWRSSDGGDTFEKIIEHCFKFGVEGHFVFASVVFNVSSGPHANKRIMHLSKDSGANFRPVNVPEITPDRFYAVVEMHKGMIFLHVDEPGDTGKGTLYISGADGLRYTKSLDNHFYTNTRHTDFTRIESMHGVYITQVLTKENTLKSVITFDRGVSWQPLYIDKDKYCNASVDCTLHFHKEYSNVKQHTDVQGPLSSISAPGIIFIHGQAGDALTGTAQVWLSTNGGYNWTKIANNPHHYAIGDNGNLLLLVPQINNTGNILKYSIDQGRCWHKYKFHDNNDEMVIRGLVTEPHAKERTFSLWGYSKNAFVGQKEWIVITINFHDMFSKKCDSSDMEEWSPHTLNGKGGCLLGEKLYYAKPKLTANCYLGEHFKPFLRTVSCKCTKDDVECDYGYERQANGTCKENKAIKPIEVCQKGEKMKVRFSKGYRRVPGDVCESTSAVDDITKFIDEKIKCEPVEKEIDVFGVVKEEKKFVTELKERKAKTDKGKHGAGEHVIYQAKTHPTKGKGHTFFLVIGVLAVVVVVIGGGWYGVKYIKNRRYVKPTYVMSDLLDEEEDTGNMYNPRPKTQRHYKDESDEEDDVMLPV